MINKIKLSSSEEQKIEDKLTRARVQMLIKFPFFGILALNLQMEMTYEIDTAATDGKKFYYNPLFIKDLEEGEINWIVVHEVLHPALSHLWRKKDRNYLKWNFACDFAIHDIMMQYKESMNNNNDSNLLKMPEGCLYDKKYENMNAEQIYDLLPEIKTQYIMIPSFGKGSGKVKGSVLDDHGLWGSSETQSNGDAKSQDWEGKLVSAAEAAESKSAGNMPGFLKRLIGKITKPQRDWRSLLNDFVQPEIDDYSFNPPDRRYGESDFFLPDFNDETISVKKMLFWIDTSGSISDKELTTFYNEIVGAINQFSNKLTGYLGFFDAAAYKPTAFEEITQVLEIKPVGGGGTNFHKPFEYVNDNYERDDVSGIVMLTDGYADWPDEKITNGIPVLWVITNETQIPPWGLKTTLKI